MKLLPLLFLAAVVLGCTAPADIEDAPETRAQKDSDSPSATDITVRIDTTWNDTLHVNL